MSITKEVFLYLIIRVIPGLLSLAIIPIIYRKLGPAVYGNFSLIQSSALLVIAFSAGLAGQPISRFYAGEKDKKNQFIFMAFLAGIMATLVYLILSLWFSFTLAEALVGIVLVFFGVLYSCFGVLFQVDSGPKAVAKFELSRAAIFIAGSLAVSYGLVHFFSSSNLLLIALMLSYMIVVLWFYSKIKPSTTINKKINYSWVFLKFNYGFIISLWLLVSGFLWFINRWLIDDVYGAAASGNYSSVHDIAYKTVGLVGGSIIMTIFPKISEFSKENNFTMVDTIIKNAKIIYLYFSALVLVCTWFVGAYSLKKVVGVTIDTVPLFLIVLGILIWQFGILNHKHIEAYEKVGFMLKAVIIAIIAHCILLWVLIERLDYLYVPGISSVLSGTLYSLIIFIKTTLIKRDKV